jgi:hypothetical protein
MPIRCFTPADSQRTHAQSYRCIGNVGGPAHESHNHKTSDRDDDDYDDKRHETAIKTLIKTLDRIRQQRSLSNLFVRLESKSNAHTDTAQLYT